MNLSERMKSVENVQVVKEDFKQLMEEKVSNFLILLTMIYTLLMKKHVEKCEKPQAEAPRNM